jgi:imidazole glycerol phosphate synthase subunit HisF
LAQLTCEGGQNQYLRKFVFEKPAVEAALAAGIFHREEVPIESVKEHMRERGIETR